MPRIGKYKPIRLCISMSCIKSNEISYINYPFQVLIYDPDNLSSSSKGYMIHPLQSNLWQLGAYFGHTVVGADLNKDSLDELIVSAPLYAVGTNAYDQGRVFVFWNTRSNPGFGEWVS